MSSMASGGGAVVSAVANADGVLALIQLLTDTGKFGERLTILKEAEDKAQAALKEAHVVAEAAATQRANAEAASLEAEQKTAAHNKMVAEFNERDASTNKHLNDWQTDLETKVKDLEQREHNFKKDVSQTLGDFEMRNSNLLERERSLTQREAAVAKREGSVAAKLAKIREIEQVG